MPAIVRVAVSGCDGRLGRRIVALARINPKISLTAGLVRSKSSITTPMNFTVTADCREAMNQADVLIEFTTPEATLDHARQLIALKKKAMVIGTTGLNSRQQAALIRLARSIPMVVDSNFSQGIAMIKALIHGCSVKTKDVFDIGISEIHRRGKKDAPSGTAKDLARLLSKQWELSPEITSLRLGEVPGEHSVIFSGAHETVEISHRVYSRDAFAAGALRAAGWVARQKSGLYRFSDVMR